MRRVSVLVAAVAVLLASQDATPPALPTAPDPSECRVAPRPPEDFVAPPPREAAGPPGTPPPWARARTEAELPAGRPVDPATAAAIVAVEREYVACLNAGDLRRATALLTEDVLRAVLVLWELEPADFLATPRPAPEAERVVLVAVRDVRALDGDRVGAVIEWSREGEAGLRTDFRVHERVGGRWLIAGEACCLSPSGAAGSPETGTPAP